MRAEADPKVLRACRQDKQENETMKGESVQKNWKNPFTGVEREEGTYTRRDRHVRTIGHTRRP